MAGTSVWMPNSAQIWDDLTYVPSLAYQPVCTWKGMSMKDCVDTGADVFSANWRSHALATNWCIPLTAVAAYLVGIVALRKLVEWRGKFDVKGFAFYWNVGLSLFSWAGVFATAPVLARALSEHGVYFATCAPAEWYGMGWSGLAIFMFVLSKLAELVDTVLLLLSGKPVILLHWWHHTTVLLFCWHAMSTRISAGIWFATINYFVHSIMYGYFAATQTSIRKRVFPFAMYITLLQIVQMVVGMWVIIKTVRFQMNGQECHANRTNSMLGLAMYFSYFVLFGKLFFDHYVLGKKVGGSKAEQPVAKRQSSAQLVRSVSRKVVQSVESEGDESSTPADRGASPVRNRGRPSAPHRERVSCKADSQPTPGRDDDEGSDASTADEPATKKDQ